MTTVKTYLATHHDKLDFYTHAITNAHGQNHPEVFSVRGQYLQLRADASADRSLDQNFAHLRQTTHDYTIPDDICPVFESTYHMLAQADKMNTAVFIYCSLVSFTTFVNICILNRLHRVNPFSLILCGLASTPLSYENFYISG